MGLLLQWRHSLEANQTLHNVWPSPGLVHYIYILRRLLPPDGILPGANFTLCPSLAFSYIGVLKRDVKLQLTNSPILAALLHGTWPVGVSQTLWRGTRNGVTELLHMAPPIFGWVAITLGIGPHSSYGKLIFVEISMLWLFHIFCSDAPIAGPLLNLVQNSVIHSPSSVITDGKLLLEY